MRPGISTKSVGLEDRGPQGPLVSVVMGTFNDADCLEKTLDSVLAQELVELELIIVNDGSTDHSVSEVLSKYGEKDERVCVISKPNEGLTRALMEGCSAAKGKYIARIDAGDVMLPQRLKKQALILDQSPDCVFVSCWTEFCGPEWEPLWITRGEPDLGVPISVLPADPRDGLTGDIPHHGSVMFRRSSYENVGGYRACFYYGQDWDLWYRLAELGKFQVVQKELYRARFFPNSISMTRKQQQDEMASCSKGAFVARRQGRDESHWLQRAALQRPSQDGGDGKKTPGSIEPGLYFIGEALRRCGDARCRKYFKEAVSHAPLKPRAYLRLVQSLTGITGGYV